MADVSIADIAAVGRATGRPDRSRSYSSFLSDQDQQLVPRRNCCVHPKEKMSGKEVIASYTKGEVCPSSFLHR